MGFPYFAVVALLFSVVTGQSAAQSHLSANEQLQVLGIDVVPERLVQYAAQGDLTTVNLLMDAGLAASSAEAGRQATALHNAAAQGHMRMVLRLLERGAEVNARDWHGVTPLIAAAHSGHTAVVALLLQNGADVNVSPTQAPTALIAAVQGGFGAIVEMLLQAGARADLPDGVGQTPLSAARLAKRTELANRINEALLKTPGRDASQQYSRNSQ